MKFPRARARAEGNLLSPHRSIPHKMSVAELGKEMFGKPGSRAYPRRDLYHDDERRESRVSSRGSRGIKREDERHDRRLLPANVLFLPC